jgi:hypothetical protein
VQKPHPPILVGGQGPRTFQRAVEWGDGWMPNRVRAEDLPDRIKELNDLAKAAGRGPIPVSIFGARPDPQMIERYREAGADRIVFGLPPAPAETVLPMLKTAASAAGL